MDYNIKKLTGGKIEIKIEVPAPELQSYLEKAVAYLSEHYKIPGFRPGKAPFEIVKRQLGEMKIYEEAAEVAVRKTYAQIVIKEKLPTLGAPQIKIEKLAPGNPLVYEAVVFILPKVELGDFSKIKVKKKDLEFKEEKIKKTLRDLAEMRAGEKVVERPARESDKVEIDLKMFQGKVPVEGGTSHNHFVYLNDNNYNIPGFNEKLLGLKSGEEKEFQLTFPKTHYNKNLAGFPVDFKIRVKNVYERTVPEINDEFARGLGNFADLAALEKQLRSNLKEEAQQKEAERQEIEMLAQLANGSTFSEIPEILIVNEKERMVEELKNNLTRQSLDFTHYLEHLKKSEDDLKESFAEEAVKRIKTGLVLRQIQLKENLTAGEEEIHQEIEKIKQFYQNQPEQSADFDSPDYHDYLATVLANRKAIGFLKEKIIGE
ncbi:MAG: trigger factor [bacterium]